VPEEALAHSRTALDRGAQLQMEWQDQLAAYQQEEPGLSRELTRRLSGTLPDGWEEHLPRFGSADGAVASRVASGKVINALAPHVPELLGGSADLAGSNNTTIKGAPQLSAENYAGRNVFYGVREHAMGSLMNGMSLHGGVVPFGGTFLIFSDYMRPAIRLAALMRRHVVYVFTHDSIGLGEDGPTHQPVEQLATLRAIPGLTVVRPADAGETVEAWRLALKRGGPVALSLTRQKLPFIDRARYAAASGVARGAYVLSEAAGGEPKVVLLATGSEVHIALEAQDELAARGVAVRVVSMPCQEVFAEQPADYHEQILPGGVKRVAIEAAHPMSWYRWVGTEGRIIGLDHFGASAPYSRIYREFGLDSSSVVDTVMELIA
jgi:transketolase